MRLRSILSGPIKAMLAYVGWVVIPQGRYGLDVFSDVGRLSREWKYPIDIIFDVGANDGSKIKIARRKFESGKIIAFEPHPKTFYRLRESMKSIENVELVNLALGSEQGETT